MGVRDMAAKLELSALFYQPQAPNVARHKALRQTALCPTTDTMTPPIRLHPSKTGIQ